MITLICPKCGKEREKTNFISGVCNNCYTKDNQLVSLRIKEVTMCNSSARIKFKNSWQPFFEDELETTFKDALDVKLEEYKVVDSKVDIYKEKMVYFVKILGHLNNEDVVIENEFKVSINYLMSDECVKMFGNYIRAVIQIRYDEDTKKHYEEIFKKDFIKYILAVADKVVKEVRRDGDYLSFVQKVEDTTNGFNIHLGSKNSALAIIKKIKEIMKYEKKDSNTLIGIDDKGRPKLKYTYLLKIKV